MSRRVVIEAGYGGPRGRLADEVVLGRTMLDHTWESACALSRDGDVSIEVLDRATGVPAGVPVLRTDRLYDASRLRRAVRRGRTTESAVIWRLDTADGLVGASDELLRRRAYQPLGRYWALAPARGLARVLRATWVRPNVLTMLSGGMVLAAAGLVAWGKGAIEWNLGAGLLLAMGLVLDTADGHLARLQGTASAFGRWLDSNLDELGDLALHAAAAWAAYVRTAEPAWLAVGFSYLIGKYLYIFGSTSWNTSSTVERDASEATPAEAESRSSTSGSVTRRIAEALGHADFRWHLWIVFAAMGWMEWALAAYAAYSPARVIGGAWRKRKAAGDVAS
jgi:phosphatidylglycerophosphate synthase